MTRRYSTFGILCAVLMVWQTLVAPLAHAHVLHTADEPVAAGVEPVLEHGAGQEMSAPEGMPCHGQAAADAHAGHDAMSGPAETPAGAGPDCCETIACQCACVHASLHAAGLEVPALVVPGHPATLGLLTAAPDARAARLFRPPI